jgi:hypothetical protein
LNVLPTVPRDRPLPPLLLSLAVLLAPLLAGCAAPAPQPEVVGSSGIVFAYRPVGSVQGVDVVWDVRLANDTNATSAPARLHLSIKSSRPPGLAHEADASIAPLPPRGTLQMQVRTPYEGTGDYTGTAQVFVGARSVAIVYVFFEQCQLC